MGQKKSQGTCETTAKMWQVRIIKDPEEKLEVNEKGLKK